MISVIVPIHNSEKYLEKCLNSIQSQTYSDFEVLLIDNGSSDSSERICRGFLNDPRFKYYYCRQKGIVNACKTGIRFANGGYFLFLDSDDFIDPQMFEIMIDRQESNNCDVVVCGYKKIEEDNHEILVKKYTNHIYSGNDLIQIKQNFFRFNEDGSRLFYSSKWNKLLRRSLLMKCEQFYTDSVQEDEDMCLIYPAILFAERIGTVDECLYYYIQHPSSVSHTLQEHFVENQLNVIQALIAALYSSSVYSIEAEQNIIFCRMVALIQKARFFDDDKALDYLCKLHDIELFSTFDLSAFNTAFMPKYKLAEAFLNMDYSLCLKLIEPCLV